MFHIKISCISLCCCVPFTLHTAVSFSLCNTPAKLSTTLSNSSQPLQASEHTMALISSQPESYRRRGAQLCEATAHGSNWNGMEEKKQKKTSHNSAAYVLVIESEEKSVPCSDSTTLPCALFSWCSGLMCGWNPLTRHECIECLLDKENLTCMSQFGTETLLPTEKYTLSLWPACNLNTLVTCWTHPCGFPCGQNTISLSFCALWCVPSHTVTVPSTLWHIRMRILGSPPSCWFGVSPRLRPFRAADGR